VSVTPKICIIPILLHFEGFCKQVNFFVYVALPSPYFILSDYKNSNITKWPSNIHLC